MRENLKILTRTSLFHNIEQKEIEDIISHLHPKIRKYKKGEMIYSSGSAVEGISIILKGQFQAVKDDFYGNRFLINEMAEASVFGEVTACVKAQQVFANVIAKTDMEIMVLNFSEIMKNGGNLEIKNKIMKNVIAALAQKYILYYIKLEHVSQRTIRGKLLSYFRELAAKSESRKFILPFSKTALAEYLSVDRSAMMRELSNMKKDNILKFTGIHFEIKETDKKRTHFPCYEAPN